MVLCGVEKIGFVGMCETNDEIVGVGDFLVLVVME